MAKYISEKALKISTWLIRNNRWNTIRFKKFHRWLKYQELDK